MIYFLRLLFSGDRAPKSTVIQSSLSGRDTSCSNPIACISSWATVPVVIQSGVCRLTIFKLISRFRPTYAQQPVPLLLMVMNRDSSVRGTNRTQVVLANCPIAAWMIEICNESVIINRECIVFIITSHRCLIYSNFLRWHTEQPHLASENWVYCSAKLRSHPVQEEAWYQTRDIYQHPVRVGIQVVHGEVSWTISSVVHLSIERSYYCCWKIQLECYLPTVRLALVLQCRPLRWKRLFDLAEETTNRATTKIANTNDPFILIMAMDCGNEWIFQAYIARSNLMVMLNRMIMVKKVQRQKE